MNASNNDDEEDQGQDCICTVCDICIIDCCTRCCQMFQRVVGYIRSQLGCVTAKKDSEEGDEIRTDMTHQIKMDMSK